MPEGNSRIAIYYFLANNIKEEKDMDDGKQREAYYFKLEYRVPREDTKELYRIEADYAKAQKMLRLLCGILNGELPPSYDLSEPEED